MNDYRFVVGQGVLASYFGQGRIIGIREGDFQYPLVVEFNDDENFLVMFTLDGRYNNTTCDPKMDLQPLRDSDVEFQSQEYQHWFGAWVCEPRFHTQRMVVIATGVFGILGVFVGMMI